MEVEHKQMIKFRKNQEVQNYLRDQMAHVEREKEIVRHKKTLDAQEVAAKTKEFLKATKAKTQITRSRITESQSYNYTVGQEKYDVATNKFMGERS